ncbi:MAG: tetratricopeptide repeat protein, partial [Candidatus Methanoperedenaceae archaeon]|nr:tetratricopeptide repeat protein [Candidatus Methanoperedenaceae archaeon]
ALEYFKNALRIFKEMRSRIETARIFLNLGDIFALKGEKKPALDYYLEAQSLAKGSSISESISERLKILRDKENVKGG